MRILLAEDSSVYQHLIGGHLKEWGFDFELARDGAQALKLLKQPDAPMLGLLDWVLPGIDGIEVCRHVRERGATERYVYTVLLTGKTDKKDLVRAMEAGAEDYLVKPFDPRTFACHRSATDPRTQIPPQGLLPYRPKRARPYLYSTKEIRRLLLAALSLRAGEGLRPWTYHCLFGLLSVTGLRISEARNLELQDVDLKTAVLTIRSGKFGKSRLVPIDASTCRVLADYLTRRNRQWASRPVSRTCSSPVGAIRWMAGRSGERSMRYLARSVCAVDQTAMGLVSMT